MMALLLLFVATTAFADFTYSVFDGNNCNLEKATEIDVRGANGVCISHSGVSAIVDCGPSGSIFSAWKWSSSSTCSGAPDQSLVVQSGSCESSTPWSLLVNCEDTLNPSKYSTKSLAHRLLAATTKKPTPTHTHTTTKPPTTTKPHTPTTTTKHHTTTAKPHTTTKKPKKNNVIRAQATGTPTTTVTPTQATTVTPTPTPTVTPSCPATGSPFPSTNAQGQGIIVFPEGAPNANGRNSCGQINGPNSNPAVATTRTPYHWRG